MFSQYCRLDLGKHFVTLVVVLPCRSIPLVFDGMDPLCDQPSIVLVITLLAAIMKDDVISGDFIFSCF